MSLADAIDRERKRPGTPCQVGHALSVLDGDDLAALEAALVDCGPGKSYSYSQIVRALRGEGFGVGDKGMVNHVHGRCSCGPR